MSDKPEIINHFLRGVSTESIRETIAMLEAGYMQYEDTPNVIAGLNGELMRRGACHPTP